MQSQIDLSRTIKYNSETQLESQNRLARGGSFTYLELKKTIKLLSIKY
jgi:hypothetical protein